jgi:hypothetical protein
METKLSICDGPNINDLMLSLEKGREVDDVAVSLATPDQRREIFEYKCTVTGLDHCPDPDHPSRRIRWVVKGIIHIPAVMDFKLRGGRVSWVPGRGYTTDHLSRKEKVDWAFIATYNGHLREGIMFITEIPEAVAKRENAKFRFDQIAGRNYLDI